jgi:hypothetical protein
LSNIIMNDSSLSFLLEIYSHVLSESNL